MSLPTDFLRRVVAIACVSFVSATLAAADTKADGAPKQPIKVGDVFPTLIETRGLVMLGGGNLPPTTGQVMIVDFWASWCAPCKASFPAFAKIHNDYSRRGLIIVGVSVDEKMADAMRFLRTTHAPFITLHDKEQNLVQQVIVLTMPTTYLIGRDGRVRYMHNGYHGTETDKLLRQQIETLLAEKS